MGAIEGLANQCRDFLAEGEPAGAAQLVNHVCGVIAADIPTYRQGLAKYRMRVSGSQPYTDQEAMADLAVLVGKMEALLDAREREMELERLRAEGRGPVVNVTATATARAEARASIEIEGVIARIDEVGGLKEEELAALKDAVELLRGKASRKDEKGFAAKLRDALDIAERGAGLVPLVAHAVEAVAPLFGL